MNSRLVFLKGLAPRPLSPGGARRFTPKSARKALLAWLAVAGSLVACGGDDGSAGTTVASSGTETAGGDSAGGLGPAAEGEEQWDGDPADEGGGDSSAASSGGENPFGDPIQEQGQPLPPRRPMSGGAASAYQQALDAARRGDDASARRGFEQALTTDRNAYKAAYNLGVLADRAGNAGRANEYYQRALSIQPDYERAAAGIVAIRLRQGNADGAVGFMRPLAEAWVRNLHLQALYAETLVHAGRYEEAMVAARRALRRDERFVPAMVAIVKASLKQGRTELAEAVVEQALAINDANAELHYLKGQLLLDQEGRLRDALTEFRRAVELQPDFVEARMALGIQMLSGGNYPEALQQFQAAVALAPTSVEAHLNLGDAQRANKQWQAAKSSFERALTMRPNLPQAHFNMGLMYMTAGAEFPGLDQLGALNKAVEEFTTYRNSMGPRLRRDDPAEGYLEDLNRQIEREQRRIERDRERARRQAERAARQAASAEGGQ